MTTGARPSTPPVPTVSNGHRFLSRKCTECDMTYAAYEADGYPWCEFYQEEERQRVRGDDGSMCSAWCGYCGRCN